MHMNLRPMERISILVLALVDAAQAGGMTEEKARSIYDSLASSYSRIQKDNPEFAEWLLKNARKAVGTEDAT